MHCAVHVKIILVGNLVAAGSVCVLVIGEQLLLRTAQVFIIEVLSAAVSIMNRTYMAIIEIILHAIITSALKHLNYSYGCWQN